MQMLSSPLTERVHSNRKARLSLAVSLCWALLLLTAFLLGACNAQAEESGDAYARYRPALRAEAQSQLDELESIPRYAIEVTLNAELDQLQGSAHIALTNTSNEPWTYLIFRLYPALKQYRGLFSIHSAAVNGWPVPFRYADKATTVRVELPAALLSGQRTNVYLSWTLDIPQWPSNPAQYYLFGRSQEIVSLPLFYPSLAVYEPGPVVGTGHWWVDQGSVRGDAAFNYASLFVVTATLPSDQVPVTSGTLITHTRLVNDQSRYVWVTGPVREFLLHTSSQFETASLTAYGTRVTSYWLPGEEASGKAALQYAAAALRVYSDRFGAYPYADLRVAPAALNFRGMEYPQAILLGVQLYDIHQDELEMRTVHEIAHQWWYQLVHNDPVNYPWIDEGLAEYSTKFYYAALRGRAYADNLQARRWQAVVDGLVKRDEDAPLNQPVDFYADGTQYEAVVYGKGALFYDAIRQRLGERRFEEFLQAYSEKYRYQIVFPEDLLTLLRTFEPQGADALYTQWIGQPPAPLSTPTTDTP